MKLKINKILTQIMQFSKDYFKIGYLGYFFFFLVFSAILSALIIPKIDPPSRTPPPGPVNYLVQLVKECAVKLNDPAKSNTFAAINLDGYSSITVAGSHKECSSTGEIIFESSNLEKYPTFKFNVDTYERTCFHNGPTDQLLGCSSRKNGEW